LLLGTTHRVEWAAFTREIKNRAKFPIALSDHLQRDKNDLFNLWLENDKSLNKLFVLNQYKFYLMTISKPLFPKLFPISVSFTSATRIALQG